MVNFSGIRDPESEQDAMDRAHERLRTELQDILLALIEN